MCHPSTDRGSASCASSRTTAAPSVAECDEFVPDLKTHGSDCLPGGASPYLLLTLRSYCQSGAHLHIFEHGPGHAHDVTRLRRRHKASLGDAARTHCFPPPAFVVRLGLHACLMPTRVRFHSSGPAPP